MTSPLQSGPSSPPDSPGLRAVTAYGEDLIETRDDLKEHYNSEWHLHNLKRKVAGLPLLTQEQFARRQAQDRINEEKKKPVGKQAKREARLAKQKEKQAARAEARAAKLSAKGKKVKPLREKHDYSREAAVEKDEWSDEDLEESEESDEEEEDEIRIIEGESLFDSELFDDWATCLEYMFAVYGFEIPNIERVIDMEGMCQYLQLKINHCHRCLYSSKRFNSREAVKHYMESMGNRRFNSETFKIEFGRFYIEDFSVEEQGLNVTQQELDAALERGVTPSGKKLVPRDLAYITRQKPKPEESRAAVLAVKAESESRTIRLAAQYGGAAGQLALFRPGATPRNEVCCGGSGLTALQFSRRDVNRIARQAIKVQFQTNKLHKLSDATLTHGR